MGFSRIIHSLLQAEKPIIGHNCFFDLLHMYQQFYKPLPENLSDFQNELHKICPRSGESLFLIIIIE